MDKVRAHLIISGKVQGVFFRYMMQQAASASDVTGWAKNTTDGKVEAVLEGNKENVEKIIEWAHKGPPHAIVGDVEVNWEDYSGELKDFSIKYF